MSHNEKLAELRRCHSISLQAAARYRPRCYFRDSGAAARFLTIAADYRAAIQVIKQRTT